MYLQTTGQRITTVDIGKSFEFKLSRGGKDIYNDIYAYRKRKNDKDLSTFERKRLLRQAEDNLNKDIQDLHEDYLAAIRLGADPDAYLNNMYIGANPANKTIKNAIRYGQELNIDETTGRAY